MSTRSDHDIGFGDGSGRASGGPNSRPRCSQLGSRPRRIKMRRQSDMRRCGVGRVIGGASTLAVHARMHAIWAQHY